MPSAADIRNKRRGSATSTTTDITNHLMTTTIFHHTSSSWSSSSTTAFTVYSRQRDLSASSSSLLADIFGGVEEHFFDNKNEVLKTSKPAMVEMTGSDRHTSLSPPCLLTLSSSNGDDIASSLDQRDDDNTDDLSSPAPLLGPSTSSSSFARSSSTRILPPPKKVNFSSAVMSAATGGSGGFGMPPLASQAKKKGTAGFVHHQRSRSLTLTPLEEEKIKLLAVTDGRGGDSHRHRRAVSLNSVGTTASGSHNRSTEKKNHSKKDRGGEILFPSPHHHKNKKQTDYSPRLFTSTSGRTASPSSTPPVYHYSTSNHRQQQQQQQQQHHSTTHSKPTKRPSQIQQRRLSNISAVSSITSCGGSVAEGATTSSALLQVEDLEEEDEDDKNYNSNDNDHRNNNIDDLICSARFRSRMYGLTHPEEVATTWNILGNAYFHKGEYDSAIDSYHTALSFFRSAYGFDTATTTTTNESKQKKKINKEKYCYKEKNTDDGSSIFSGSRSYMSSNTQSYFPDDEDEDECTTMTRMVVITADRITNIAATLTNLGTAYWRTGRSEESIYFLERALKMRVRAVGAMGGRRRDIDTNVDIAAGLYQLGLARCLQGEYAHAMEALKRAHTIQRTALGPTHVELARTIDAMGKVYLLSGNADDALERHREALRIKQANIGKSHPTVLSAMMNIAAAHRARGELDESLDIYQEVLDVQRSILSLREKKVDETLTSSMQRTSAHQQNTKKQAVLSSALFVDIGITLQTMGELYKLRGDTKKSVNAFTEALLMYRDAGLRDEHFRVKTLQTELNLSSSSGYGEI